ncbi:membrane-associated phospholipid phosphatase [Actimicrobium sp. GrIS 1.19]|uniref:phosphatase PAP2 family protein n=1 Tax=Actimicrobium sp. GrIS 1.19 TaxID=3071708 RepID=UPI002DFD6C4E|nr:membrane-associated phospholipid phosphatase [Actimicrobium sp. GrIS 1.19]
MWDNHFNLVIINWLGQFNGASASFNQLMQYVEGAHLFKGLPVMGVLWFFWFRDTDPKSDTRRRIIATLVGCFVAVCIARVVNNLAPFQPRPFANAALAYHNYVGLGPRESQSLFDWNSFPSDHAALFFSLAMGIFFISRGFGAFVFLYVFVVIAMPRVYLGLHYPTDIVAGAALGMASVALCASRAALRSVGDRCMRLLQQYPAAFQTVLFIVSVEISMMFSDVRRFLTMLKYFL